MSITAWSALLVAEGKGFLAFRLANISEGNGIPIAITGMVIVFVALALISLAISVLPRVLAVLDPYLPSVADPHQSAKPAKSLPGDEERVVAAIGMVLHAEMHRANKG